jgi:TM2 domain-containing membrane protein YozV
MAMTHASTFDPRTAAFLSFLIPGWGQFRKGKRRQGAVWLVVVIAGYLIFVVPGVILHLLCIIEAYWRD